MNKLDEAKLNLKNVLNRLETIVNQKLHQVDQLQLNQEIADKISKHEQEILEFKLLLKERDEEIIYLREQNHELQASVGIERERSFKLQQKNTDAARKVDEIIGEVRSYLSIN